MGRGGAPGGPPAAPPAPPVLTPAGQALLDSRKKNNGQDMPSSRCLPHGLINAISIPEPFKIIQTPSVVVVLQEEFNNYRQILIGKSAGTVSTTPGWFGHSTGTWQADGTLVVDTKNFRDGIWLDLNGRPASDALHITERLKRRDFGHIDAEYTIEDPKMFVKPYTQVATFDLMPDTELIEHICENEQDQQHRVK